MDDKATDGKFIFSPREIIEDTRLSFWQLKVLLALYSFRNKNTDLVFPSRESISKRCGIRPSSISKTTSELVELGWLKKYGKGGNKKTIKYQVTVPDLSTVQESCTVQEISTITVQESCTQKNTIEEYPIIKTPVTPKIPEWINLETWEEFRKHRKRIKKPMTDYAEKKMFIKLNRLKEEGHDPNQLLDDTIMNGWQGIVTPDKVNSKSRTRFPTSAERAREDSSWIKDAIMKEENGNDKAKGHIDGLGRVHRELPAGNN